MFNFDLLDTQNAINSGVTSEFVDTDLQLPLQVQPKFGAIDAAKWIADHGEYIESTLNKYGAMLLRGFDVQSPDDFRAAADAFIPSLAAYMEGATPRTNLGKGTYTSTEFPNEQSIAQHNELSYITQWPMKIAFSCMVSPEKLGATPIADVRKVYSFIPDHIVKEFEQRGGWRLVRNYGNGLGPTWQKAFNTDDIEAVKAYCKDAQVELEIISEQQVRTSQVRPAFRPHAITGETVWFNHAAFWHPSSLCPIIRKELVSQFGEDALPYNTTYGDGTSIPDEIVDEINLAYKKATVRFDWKEGDILLMDNMMVSHGREPFEGERKILVSMGNPVSA